MSVLFCDFAQEQEKIEESKAAEARKEKDIVQSFQIEDIIRRGEGSQLMQRMQQEATEARLEKEIFQERKRKEIQAKHREIAQLKAEAEQKEFTENLQKEKKIQQIRTGTQELRDLERKLRACYVGKENLLRIREKEMSLNDLKERLRKEQQGAELQRKQEAERERLMKEDEERKKYALRLAQQQQIIDLQKRKEEAYREFVREKLMMDIVAQEIMEEERQKELACLMKEKATRKQIDNFLACRERWKQHLREEMDKENLRIQQYLDSQVDRSAEEKKAKQEKWDKHMDIVNRIAAKIYTEKQRAMEKEQILQDFAEIEADEAHEKRLRAEMQAAINARKDLRVAMCQQLKERAKQLQKEQEEEMEVRRAMLADLAEKERIEQLTNERKRIKIMEHRAGVDRIITERRLRRHIEMEKILREEEDQREESREEDRLIEEERLRLLREHAHKLLGFMPVGILREGDEEKLGPEFESALRRFQSQRLNCD